MIVFALFVLSRKILHGFEENRTMLMSDSIISLLTVIFVHISLAFLQVLKFDYCTLHFLLAGRPRPAAPYIGSMQATRGAYMGGYGYQQPVPYNYQQGLMYPNYG